MAPYRVSLPFGVTCQLELKRRHLVLKKRAVDDRQVMLADVVPAHHVASSQSLTDSVDR